MRTPDSRHPRPDCGRLDESLALTPQCIAGKDVALENYRDRGFVVLGFPANDFLRQEPGTNQEIQQFCTLNYGVTFPMFARIAVKDSILWGNGVDSTGTVTIAWSCYSNSTDHADGGDNMTLDPLFVDTTYYHLQSQGGNYVGGYFSGGTWSQSAGQSPCIDAGDPTVDVGLEPDGGGRINMGAYGGTSVASHGPPPAGTVIFIR